MAYTRPPHQNHQLSYGSSRGNYAAKTVYDPRGQAAEINGSTRRGPQQEYITRNVPPTGTRGYDEDWPDQDNSFNGDNGRYGDRGQNRGGRWPPPPRQHGRLVEAGPHLRNGPQNRGPPHGRGRYRQQDLYYQSNHYREPQNYEQHYQPEGVYPNGPQLHENSEYRYDEFSHETSDNWTPMQHYNHSPHSNDHAYPEPEYNAGYPRQDQGGLYDSRVPKVPASTIKHNQPNSTGPYNFQQLKPCKSAKT